MSAVILLQEMMLRRRLDPSSLNEDELDEIRDQEAGTDIQNKDKVAVLAIAYHNMGVEQEFLRSYPAAILSYKKAVNFAEKNLGPEDGITQNLRSVYENAKNELDMALFKKGKKGPKKGKRRDDYVMAEGYQDMITEREGQMMQNMEQVDEAQEEEGAGPEESNQQVLADSKGQELVHQ